jgi:hypothetical protein
MFIKAAVARLCFRSSIISKLVPSVFPAMWLNVQQATALQGYRTHMPLLSTLSQGSGMYALFEATVTYSIIQTNHFNASQVLVFPGGHMNV